MRARRSLDHQTPKQVETSAAGSVHESDQSLTLLLANVREYAIFILDPEGIVRTWNAGAQRVKGYAADEIVGRHFSIFYEAADVRAGKPDWELVVAEREGRFEDEGWRIRKDGSKFWANVVITALRDEKGQLRGFGKVTRDISERRLFEQRQAEQQSRETEQLKQHAERMSQLEKIKRDFLNLASHELRGPISVLRGYISMFEDRTLSVDRFPEFVPLLSAKLSQIELLVSQMLDTARLEEDRLVLRERGLDLREVVAQAVERLRPLASPGLSLNVVTSDVPVVVMADRERIDMVVSNLLSNAIKYSPNGGSVTCLLATSAARGFLSVRDQGIGIAKKDLPRLFTPFSRIVTPENAHISGVGLGLYLSREIVRQQGGDILVDSVVGQGSRFTLSLPLLAAREPGSALGTRRRLSSARPRRQRPGNLDRPSD